MHPRPTTSDLPLNPAATPSRSRGAQPPAARPRPASSPELQHRAPALWLILRFLAAAAEIGLNDTLLTYALTDLCDWSAPDDLQRELAYLRQLGLVETGRSPASADGVTRITRAGRALVAHRSAVPALSARPARRK